MNSKLLIAFAILFVATGCGGLPPAASDAGLPPADAGIEPGTDAGLGLDAGEADAGAGDAGRARPEPPTSIFFVGNSFTYGGPVPRLVEDLALYAGWPAPYVDFRAVGGQSLEGHRADLAPEGAPARIAEGWEVVVLQELSTRPTDAIGDPERFKEDATWFYDRAKEAAPGCRVILYETWARRAGHAFYPDIFTDPAMMQAELRAHYRDAVERYIPEHSGAERPSDVELAPAGDAWERQLAGGEPPRLHDTDDYHASSAGAYLSALVIYSTIYGSVAEGLVPLMGLDEGTAAALQRSADLTTGQTGRGPFFGAPLPIEGGSVLGFDLGTIAAPGWPGIGELRGTAGTAATEAGEASSAQMTVWDFSGSQEGGSASNGVGLPAEVSQDTLWVGSFDGHAAALGIEARVVLRGLPSEGRYRIALFASRVGDDSGLGRLTRYTIGAESRDLEVSDNTDRSALFDDVAVDGRGEILLRVSVSPAGTARFAYLGAVRITRL